VGLDFVGATDGSLGYANPISHVMSELDLSLNMLDCTESPCLATETARSMPQPRPVLHATVDFRDRVLAGSPRGREYIAIFYRHTAAFVALVRTNPTLLAQTAELYQQHLPLLQALSAGRGYSVSPQQIQAVDQLFARYQQLSADPQLRADVGRLREDLRDPDALRQFGVTVR
jgi:hypothetical protein